MGSIAKDTDAAIHAAGVGPESQVGWNTAAAPMPLNSTEKLDLHRIGIAVPHMPRRVFTATDVKIGFLVACDQGCNLAGGAFSIKDQNGACVFNAVLAPYGQSGEDGSAQGEAYVEAVLAMPASPGRAVWEVSFTPPASEKGKSYMDESVSEAQTGDLGAEALDDGADVARHEVASCELVLEVEPHTIALNVWGIPSPAVAGDDMPFFVAAKCPAGCDLSGLSFSVEDAAIGSIVAHGVFDTPAGESGGMWQANVHATAPACGVHTWRAVLDNAPFAVEHPCKPRQFSFVTVDRRPDTLVSVSVFDRGDGGAPLPYVNVALVSNGLPPYRGVTDDMGICEVAVPSDVYSVHASKASHRSGQICDVEVADMPVALRIDLDFMPDY